MCNTISTSLLQVELQSLFNLLYYLFSGSIVRHSSAMVKFLRFSVQTVEPAKIHTYGNYFPN